MIDMIWIISKQFALIYFFIIFCGILFWAFRGKNKDRFEEGRHMPLKED